MKKIFYPFAFILLCVCKISFSQDLPEPETRGVWITANYLKGTNAIETLVKKLSDANFNTLFVDSWYSGATLYPSSVVSKAGGPSQHSDFMGTDPLRTVIDIAHKYKMEVFAWMEFGMAVGYGYSLTDAPAIIKAHPDWSMVDRDGKIAEADPWGGYLFWVDPSVNAAADFIVDLYTECAEKYPDIDGIEVDRMRYPFTSFSYSDTSRTKFVNETGYPDPLTLGDNHAMWSDWRRQQVTNVVKRIYTSVKNVNPQCIITGAVVPPYMMYGGGDDKLQAWDVWAKNSYVDILEPMLYLPVSDYGYQLNLCKNYVPNGFQLAPGIDINSAGSAANTISEIKTTRTAGMAGEIMWYYGYLSNEVISSLKSSVYTYKISPTHNDLIIDDASKGRFKTTGTWNTSTVGYKGVFKKSNGAEGDTAIYSVRILREGNYSLYGYWGGDSTTNNSNTNVSVSNGIHYGVNIINQQKNLNRWNLVNVFHFNSGDTVIIKLFGSGGNLIADAFRFRLNPALSLMDYIMVDNQTLHLKFTNNLLNPISGSTKISSSVSNNLNFFVDNTDNTILQIKMEPVNTGQEFMIKIENLLDINYDTLDLSLNIIYDPDKTYIIIDDSKPNSFWKLLGTWQTDTNHTAIENSFWFIKQSDKTVRVQWGPYTVLENGFYDVFVSIPETTLPLTEQCIYIVKDKNGTDSIYVDQSSTEQPWLNLGNFSYNAGDIFSVLLSSISNSDTGKYIVADAVMLKRTLESTPVEIREKPEKFIAHQNYPNPFNPETTISFSLNEEAKVFVKIFNSLGQEVTELANGRIYQPGTWKILFNGNNLPSGIYFARIFAKSNNSEQQKIIKMALVK